MSNLSEKFLRFVEVINKLRDPQGGCPWDLEQNHLTLRPYLIEESYEVLEAIENADDKELCAELGDVLLQVVLHSQIAKERKAFSIDDVILGVTEKMINRHPHVFGEKKVNTADEVLKNWEILKAEERNKNENETRTSVIDGIPVNLPALIRAQRMGEKAARVGFDWETLSSVLGKLQEELGEFKEEVDKVKDNIKNPLSTAPQDRPEDLQIALESELGDTLFALCQIGRWLGLSTEDSLRRTIKKFELRFKKMEDLADKPLNELDFASLDGLWENAKKIINS